VGLEERERAAELFERAYSAQMAGRLEEAADLYAESIRLHPTAEAHTFLGWAWSFLGRVEEAIAECRKAIEVDPDFGNPYNDIGAYLIELGRHDEAVPWLRKAMEAPRYEPRHYPHLNLARVHLHRNEWGEAAGELRRTLEIAPDCEPARRELAKLLARMN
jgi:Tfp pilus assembly protein PilF